MDKQSEFLSFHTVYIPFLLQYQLYKTRRVATCTDCLKVLSTEKQLNLTIFSYGFTYAFRFSVFSVFCRSLWLSHPLQHHTPGLNVYMKEHVNFIRNKHRQKKGSWSKIVPLLQQGM